MKRLLGPLLAALLLLFAPHASASTLAQASRQFEQLKFSWLQQSIAQRSASGVFVTATEAAGERIQQVRLRQGERSPARDIVLSPHAPWRQSLLENVQAGEYTLELVWTDAQGTQHLSQKKLSITEGWWDLQLQLQQRFLGGEELHIVLRSRKPADWGTWQRIAAWIPGLVSDEAPSVRRLSELNSFQWVNQQCGQSLAPMRAQQPLLELLHILSDWPTDSLGAEVYSLLTRCLLAHGLLGSTLPIVQEQLRESKQNATVVPQLELLARRLAAAERWPELRALPVHGQASPRLHFYRALAAARQADWDEAIAGFGTLYKARRTLQWETYQAADALTMQAGFNLAMALQAAGRQEEHWFVLDELGRLSDVAPAAGAARERANLQLGWALLNQERAASARPVFDRMALHGPYSRHALLGMGWSVLLPQGAPIPRPADGEGSASAVMAGPQTAGVLLARHRAGEMPCEAVLQGTGRPDLCNVSAALQRRLAREERPIRSQDVARVAWEELSRRELPDFVSLESILARADLHRRAGEDAAYLALLRRAEPLLGQMKSALSQARQMAAQQDEAVFSTALPALQLWLREAEPHGLRQIIAELRQWQELWSTRTGQGERLEELVAFEQQLSRTLFGQLAAETQRQTEALRRYELDLRLRLARYFDPMPAQASQSLPQG